MDHREVIRKYIKESSTSISKIMFYLGCYRCWIDEVNPYITNVKYNIKYKIRLWNPISWIFIFIWAISIIILTLVEEDVFGAILSIPKVMQSTYTLKKENHN